MFELNQAQRALQQRARDLARAVMQPRAAETDCSEAYPWHSVEALKNNGFMGMTMPVPMLCRPTDK